MYLGDLTFIDDGNNDFSDPDKKIINFDKRSRLANIIAVIQRLQNEPYKFHPNDELINELQNIGGYDENHEEICYSISKYIENISGVLTHDDISEIDVPNIIVYNPKIPSSSSGKRTLSYTVG